MPSRNVLPKPYPAAASADVGDGDDAGHRTRRGRSRPRLPRRVAAGYEEQERRTKEYHRRIRQCEPVGGIVNDQVHTMNFLYCHEDYREARNVGVPMVNTFNIANAHLYWTREAFPTRAYQTLGNVGAAMKGKTAAGRRSERGERVCPKALASAIRITSCARSNAGSRSASPASTSC